jgi:hypothetical protein
MATFGKRSFNIVRGSDVVRDGMYLELNEEGGKQGLAEVFFFETGEFVANTFGNDVPLEALEWLAAKARSGLPPET